MENSFQNNSITIEPVERDLDIILSLLGSGKSVELPAEGYSMFPALRPGQRFIVKPLPGDMEPEVGSVVVMLRKEAGKKAQGAQGAGRRAEGEGVMVMHRLVRIIKDEIGNILYITRGDSRPEDDKPWGLDEIIGVVDGKRSRNSVVRVRVFMPGKLRRWYNKWVLWGYWKIKRMRGRQGN